MPNSQTTYQQDIRSDTSTNHYQQTPDHFAYNNETEYQCPDETPQKKFKIPTLALHKWRHREVTTLAQLKHTMRKRSRQKYEVVSSEQEGKDWSCPICTKKAEGGTIECSRCQNLLHNTCGNLSEELFKKLQAWSSFAIAANVWTTLGPFTN